MIDGYNISLPFLVDELGKMDVIYSIFDDVTLDERSSQIYTRQLVLRAYGNFLKTEHCEIYRHLKLEMEIGALYFMLNSSLAKESIPLYIEKILKIIQRKYYVSGAYIDYKYMVIALIGVFLKGVIFDMLYFIEMNDMMDLSIYEEVNKIKSEYRQYKIQKIII